MNLSGTRVFIIPIVIIATLTMLPSARAYADDCDIEWYYNETTQIWSYSEICYPEYYSWQYSEPDWCLYGEGDEVLIDHHIVNNQIKPWRWWVTPYYDSGRDGDYYVYNCQLLQYPW